MTLLTIWLVGLVISFGAGLVLAVVWGLCAFFDQRRGVVMGSSERAMLRAPYFVMGVGLVWPLILPGMVVLGLYKSFTIAFSKENL